jgi:hypothetical protein
VIRVATPAAEIGEPCLARFGGVDSRCLDALALPGTLAAIDAARAAGDAMEAARPAVEAELHRLVGMLEDRRLRRAALNTRRDAHNARCRTAAAIVAELAQLATPAGSRALRTWSDAASAQACALEAANAQLPPELESATRRLELELAAPELRRGIAMASPDFHDELARGTRHLTPGGKTARTALSYLSRAAVKTSPFSTLTTVGWARMGSAPAGSADHQLPPIARRLHRVLASKALAVELLVGCARDDELAEALEFETNPTIGMVAGGAQALVATRMAVNGFAWRREEIVDLAPLGELPLLLRRVGRARAGAFHAALGGPDPKAAFVRMLDLDIVRPVLPWTPDDEPLEELAGLVAALPGERARGLANELRDLHRELTELGDADGPLRARAQRTVSRRARGWMAAVGQPCGHWIDDVGAAYEDVVEDGRVELGEHVRADLQRVASEIWPDVRRSRLYDELVGAFVEQHGRGGMCDDVLAFLVHFLAGGHGIERVDRAIRADLQAQHEPSDAGRLVASHSGSTALPSAMVRFQIAAATHADVLAGRYRLVVNQCSQGAGGLLARFVQHDESGVVATELHAWLSSLAPGAEVVHVGFASDWSALQAVSPQIAEELDWPGNLLPRPRDPRRWRLDELELRHAPSTGDLALRSPDGRRLVPIYLGTVPQYLVRGPARLLMALGDPWLLNSGRDADSGTATGAVVASERRKAGRVVLSRRRWRVRPDCLPALAPGESDVAFLRRAHDWRREHDIPVEVFATSRRSQMSFDPRLRKPRWVRFDSLHAMRAAEGLLGAGVTAVDLTEALPSREEHWVRAADGSPRASEFVALVRWHPGGATSPA